MKEFRWKALFGLALLCSCQRTSSEQVLPAASARASASAPAPKPRANHAASAIVAIRERQLTLGAPPELPRHLAFGRGFLVQATASEVVIRSSEDAEVSTRLPLAARAVLSLPAGSVLIVAADASYRIDPGETRTHRLSRISLLPDTLLLPDLTTQAKVWVVSPSFKKAQRHTFDAETPLGIETERPLHDHDGGAVAVLSDGDLLYTAGRELVRDPGFGRPRRFRLPDGIQRVWRLAAADHIDRTWLVTPDGAILLLELSERPRVVRRITTDLAPLDFAASRTVLALVGAREHADKAREFLVTVFGLDGEQRFSLPLPPAPISTDPDWAAKALRDREVVIGETRVAVGGVNAVELLDARSTRANPGRAESSGAAGGSPNARKPVILRGSGRETL